MPARARAKLSAASSSRPAACWSSPRTAAGAGAGERSTSAVSVATASSRRPWAAATRARPISVAASPGAAVRARSYAAAAPVRSREARSWSPMSVAIVARSSGALVACSACSMARRAPSRSPCSSRRYDRRESAALPGRRASRSDEVGLGLVVAAELDAGVDEDGQRVGVVGHLLVRRLRPCSRAAAKSWRERASTPSVTVVAGSPGASAPARSSGAPGEVVEGRVAGGDGLPQVAAGQLLPGRQVLRIVGRPPLELGDGARRRRPRSPRRCRPDRRQPPNRTTWTMRTTWSRS